MTAATTTRVAAMLFVASALAYMLTAPGHLGTVDMRAELAVAQAIVGKADFTVAPNLPYVRVPFVVAPSGAHYSEHDVGQSLLLIPAALVGRLAGCADPATCPPIAQHDAEFIASFLDGLAAAIAVTLMFLLAVELGAATGPALALALIFGFATIEWAYAHDAFDVGPTATALLLMLYGALRGLRRDSSQWVLVSGAGAALAIALRLPSVISVAIVAVFVVVASWRFGKAVMLRRAASFAAPVVAALAVIGWYNWVRFGDPLQTGQGLAPDYFGFSLFSLPEGLAGFLASPGRSIFLFSPVLLAAIVGFRWFWRENRGVAIVVLALVGGNLLFYSAYRHWWGDYAWGPRFLVPVMAFLLLPLLPVLQRWRTIPAAARCAVYGLVAVGVVVQLLDVSLDFQHQIQLQVEAGVNAQGAQAWTVQDSGIWRHGESLAHLLTGSAPYPKTFQFTDLATALPLSTVPDWWWVYAWINGVDPLVLVTILGGSVAVLVVLVRWVRHP